MDPVARLHAYPHADGSASYSQGGITILCTVSGPLEAQRRDELPSEAFLEVNVRPATGTGGPRDRQLEAVIRRTLQSIILTSAMPRALLQITLQILSTGDEGSSGRSEAPPHQAASLLPLLPGCVNASVLALLAGNVALRTTCVACLVEGGVKGRTRHVFAFDGQGACVLAESEGQFDLGEWTAAEAKAQQICCGGGPEQEQRQGGLRGWMRDVVEEDLRDRVRWREQ